MNLRNITKIGFISNFNSRSAYPEFGAKTAVVSPPVERITQLRVHKSNEEVKNAIKSWNKTKPKNYKPKLLTSGWKMTELKKS